MSPPKTKTLSIRTEPPSRLAEHTPPPSPGAQQVHVVDTEGISDDVVVATIKQLEKTANRPHLVKELAAVLCHCIGAVEK
jgi:transcriptional regulator GlxA family with amidase domain